MSQDNQTQDQTPDELAKLTAAFQEVLINQMAQEEQKVAKARTEATNIEIGTVPADSRVVKTFGRTTVVKNNDGSQSVVNDISTPIAESKITQSIVADRPSFDIDREFAKMRGLTDPDERESMAQQLFVNIGQEATVAQQRIRTLAAQQAGVNDAQASLDKNIALDNAAVAIGRIRPGDTTTQTTNARATFQAALQSANQLETDLIKKDPDIQKYNDYRALLTREFGQIDKMQQRKEAKDAVLPPLTDARLMNAKHAIGIETNDTRKLKEEVGNYLLKDKALVAVIDATKQDFPKLLVDPDAKVRRYAYNIIAGYERSNLGLGPKEELPGYVLQLEKLVADREALMSPEAKKELSKPTSDFSKASGEKAKGELRTNALYNNLVKTIEETTAAKYQRMDLWSFTNPQMKEVVDSVRANSPKGKVLMTDGVTAVMGAELKNPDGSKMTPQQKITALTQSLEVSMGNDQGSAILPSVQNYLPVFATEVRNAAQRAYVRSTLNIGRFAGPLAFISDERIGGLLLSDTAKPGMDLESGIPAPTETQVTPVRNNNRGSSDTGPSSLLGARRG